MGSAGTELLYTAKRLLEGLYYKATNMKLYASYALYGQHTAEPMGAVNLRI